MMAAQVHIMKPQITLLYGSQTGNAEDMTKRIGYKAKSLGYDVLVEVMDDFALKTLPREDVVIFICSTTGHGQEPENMKNFYNFIRRRDLPKGCLSNIKFAVYGLGDSSYSKFNYVSKILFKRLKECGAQQIHELVAGDEQHQFGCDGSIYPKLDELWSSLDALYPERVININPKYTVLPENSYTARLYSDDEGLVATTEFKDEFVIKYNLQTAHCIVNERLTPESHFQDTRFLSFKLYQPIEYEAGDVCTILPANSPENVRQFLEILDLDPKQRFNLEKNDPKYMINYLYDFVPDGLEVGQLVKYFLDIQSVPRRSFFEFLWPLSEDELERDKLKEFASTEGQEEMYEYCTQPKRSILEVLLDFPNTVKNIKFEYIFDLIPPIKPRSFSIASSSIAHPGEVQLIVGVVSYKTRLRKIRKGLCSNYLASIKPLEGDKDISDENKLKFFVKRSSFKLPANDETPIILIGPGLGIAPLRSFIEERIMRHQISNTKTIFGVCCLYFGCRYQDADFYFKDELMRYADDNHLRLRVAYSREKLKQYVQDLLIADSELIRKLMLSLGGVIYVAGNSKLPEDLRKLLGQILVDQSGDTELSSDGEKLVANLESHNRIQYDCW